LHTKSFIFDRQKVFIGSLNLDPRSVIENSEIGVILDAEEIASGMSDIFDQDIDKVAFKLTLETDEQGNERIRWSKTGIKGKQVFYHDPHTSIWQRFLITLISILPIESQL
jgi:putative cardiolipin synthase